MNIGDHLAELGLQYGADDIDGTFKKSRLCTWQGPLHLLTMTASSRPSHP